MKMKSKGFALTALSILAVFLFVGLASAALTISDSDVPTSVDQLEGTFTITFNLTNDAAAENLTWDSSTISGGNAAYGTFSLDSIGTTTETVSVDVSFSETYTGNITGTIQVDPSSGGASQTLDFTVEVTEHEFCEYADNENLLLEIKDITVVEGFGDDTDWLPLDQVEIEIEVENKGDEKIRDIKLEWGLWDVEAGEFVIDGDESDFDLKDDKDDTLYVTFTLDDPDDFKNGDDYLFFAWATGEDGEFDGAETCVQDSEEINVIIENDFVVLDNIQFSDPVECGADVTITADVWNIGDNDQDEVSVTIVSSSLGVSEEVLVGDIDEFDDVPFTYTFTVPADAEEQKHSIRLRVYDEDKDVYENDYDDDLSEFNINPEVLGGCLSAADTAPTVSVNLESEAKAGEELTVRVTITNPTDSNVEYFVNAAGYTGWANTASLSQDTFTIAGGASADVVVTFDVKGDVSGEQLFNIEILSEGQFVASQPVQVFIEESGLGWFSGDGISENSTAYALGLLNIILIIVIIVVAVRVARK